MARHQELSPGEVQREREMLRELQKFHRGASEPLATQLALKRLHMPRVDADTNPFCMDRQLADEYERMNFNKNPRFYIITLDKPALPRENPRNYSSVRNRLGALSYQTRRSYIHDDVLSGSTLVNRHPNTPRSRPND